MALKFLIGLLLLPLCWVSIETFFLLFRNEAISGAFYNSPQFFFFGAGAIACLLLCRPNRRNRLLMWLYVAGHELTHTLFVLICRGQVSKIHITPGGGHIRTNRNNFLISLSPYFFPFYTILTILVWALLEWQLTDFSESDAFWLYGLIGLTWMFHVTYTVWILRGEQTDVRINGRVFSFSVILLVNLLVISALVIVASPTATFRNFGLAWFQNFQTVGQRLLDSVGEILEILPI